jgi:CHASE2 domain-containing sensor protein
MRIFISYRRDDSSVHARLLHRELSAYFGAESVFMDYEDIGWGDNFAQRIDAELARADVVVVVVGPRWVEIVEQRLRGDDWVRHEVEQALKRRAQGRLRVLPVLVGGARWQGDRLPRGLSELALLNAPTLRDSSFDQDVVALVEAIRRRSLWRELVALAHARRARLAGLALGLAAAVGAWTGVLDLLGLDTRLATATMLVAGAVGAPPARHEDLVLVPIDEDALRAVGRPFDASWRAEHAQLVDRARAAGARAIAFDLFFDAPGDAAADAALVQALQRAQGRLPVLLAANEPAVEVAPGPGATGGVEATDAVVTSDRRDDRSHRNDRSAGPRIWPALQPLAGWGLGCAGRRLGLAYAMPLVVAPPDDGPMLSSLALAAFSGGVGPDRIGAHEVATRTLRVRDQGSGRDVDVAFYGAGRLSQAQRGCPLLQRGAWVADQLIDPATLAAPFSRVAYADLLRGDPVALSALRERIVLVGPMLPDRDRLPVAGGPMRWGMQLIAAQIDGLLQGRAVRSPGPLFQAGLGIALGLGGAALAVALHGRHGAWLAGALGLVALGFGVAVLVWYRVEGQLVGVHYGWVALGLGGVAARRIMGSAL